MKVKIEVYPAKFEFEVDIPLPPFKEECVFRTEILHRNMHMLKIYSYGHLYEDYVVSEVTMEDPDTEIWILSS